MRKKRERLEVIYDILKTVQEKQKIGPTRLLQMSNLSPQMFKEYLQELIDNGLLEEEIVKKKKMYVLSDKGYEFLKQYKMFSNFVNNLGL